MVTIRVRKKRKGLNNMPKPKHIYVQEVLNSIQKSLEPFKATLEIRRFTRDIAVYDVDGMLICAFDSITVQGEPVNLEIGENYREKINKPIDKVSDIR